MTTQYKGKEQEW